MTPMFPLGSVLTRGQVLPLHVFEPRYRRLVGDCLEGDGRFGVVLIERGSEVGGGDVRSDVGTMATIVDARAMADGRWAVVAVGGERIRITGWGDDDPYPCADVALWPDEEPSAGLSTAVGEAATRLRDLLRIAADLGVDDLRLDLDLDPDPETAADQLVAVSPLGPLDRHRLLGCPGPDARMAMLVELLDDAAVVLRAQLGPGGPPGGGPEVGGPEVGGPEVGGPEVGE